MEYFKIKGDASNIIVSNSSLSAINPDQGGSPKKFIDFLTNNFESNDSRYNRIGSIVDIYIEDIDKYNDTVSVDQTRPTQALFDLVQEMLKIEDNNPNNSFGELELASLARQSVGFQMNWKQETFETKYQNEASSYYNFAKENRNKVLLTEEENIIVTKCINSLKENSTISTMLFENNQTKVTQCAIYFKVSVKLNEKSEQGLPIYVELKCKALLDQIIIDTLIPAIIINDVKTTGFPISKFEESIEKYRYYRQLTFYRMAVDQWLKGKALMVDNTTGEKLNFNNPDIDKVRFYTNLITVETSDYFYSNMFQIRHDSKWLEKGKNEIMDLLQRIAWHKHHSSFDKQRELINGFSTVKEPEL